MCYIQMARVCMQNFAAVRRIVSEGIDRQMHKSTLKLYIDNY